MKYKLDPYQKCVLLALMEYGRTATDEQILHFLKDVGWTGLALVPERVEIALMELHHKGLWAKDSTYQKI